MPLIRSNRTPLEKIEAEIARCKETIANLQAEIQEYETAAAIIRRVEGGSPEQRFTDKKIRECATILLRKKSPQHFKALAKEAVARGYRSQKGGDVEIIARSFLSALTLFKNDFERVGPGSFRLKKRPGTPAPPAK
jgi:hypothetical protein